MGRGGCAGIATLLGPPTVGAGCYMVWSSGVAAYARRLKEGVPTFSFVSNCTGLFSGIAAYNAQLTLLVRHFDEGGALSLNWKRGTESLGEPLKIQTWTQFYRAAGPPVFARTAALLASFYCAGYAACAAASRWPGDRY